MKKIHLLLFAVLLVSVSSCHKEDANGYDIDNENTLDRNQSRGLEAQPTATEAEKLENTLQWVSYMTAQILTKEVNGTSEFMDAYATGINDNGYSIIQLSDLLSNTETNESFRSAFENEFYIFSNDTINPCENQGRPEGRLKPPPCQGTPPCANYDPFLAYIDYLIQDHCLELYVSANFDLSQNIISTGHPMDNNATTNVAYNHAEECFVFEITYDLGVSESLTANSIVARPFREETNCEYNQFLDIPDFTLFPNN